MSKVWKYPLVLDKFDTTKPVTLRLSLSHAIRHVNWLDGEVTLWIEVSTNTHEVVERSFHILNTGDTVPPMTQFVGSCIERRTDGGIDYVWHVYRDMTEDEREVARQIASNYGL